MNIRAEIPEEIIVDAEAKEVIVTPELEAALPGAASIFERVDEPFKDDPHSYLTDLEDNILRFRSSTRANVECSLIPGSGDEMFVMWAPFSDSVPQSSAEQMYNYTQCDDPGMLDKVFGKPNSWNQTTKSAVMAEVLKQAGCEMPVLTIYSPQVSFPFNTYTRSERDKIKHGDFTPAGRVTMEAVRAAQDRLHGPSSETQISALNLHGASLGASSAGGAARGVTQSGEFDVKTFTGQEMIVAPDNLLALGKGFTIGGTVGEASDITVPEGTTRIGEPLLRRSIDRAGNEPAMFAHMAVGASKFRRLQGLTGGDANEMPRIIEELSNNDVSVMIALAENSGLTHETPDFMPDAGERIVTVRALAGQRIAHLLDEYVTPTTLLAATHVASARA